MTHLSSMAETVLAHLEGRGRRNVTEICQFTKLRRDTVLDALWELKDRGLAEPVEWKATDNG